METTKGRSYREDLISSLHLRLLSSTGVSVGAIERSQLPIERSQLPIERSQLRNLNPLPFDSGPVRKLLSSPNPRRIVPISSRYRLQLVDEMVRF
ncbi:BnaC02g48570D [Brassica napus]|uniref:BnaC02g48570D protein n=1 Tax=Brassica napus TaxID=3708 RepID=A0A078IXG7_BRANA|nr:BnaC02g48570D [Brassica napus]